MIHIFLTGDSSGIGQSLKEIILNQANTFLYGLSRRADGKSGNYKGIKIDLSSTEQLKNFEFPDIEEADQIVLINNAGQVGPIKPLFEQNEEEIESLFTINTTAPTVLISKFIQAYPDKELIIINISSGAAKSPIQAWSTYCASKSALEMITLTLMEDLQFRNKKNVKVYSVSPGVIDTAMQGVIRSSKPENFSMYSRFKGLKDEEELIDPSITAGLIYKIISEPEYYSDNFINLREYY